MKTDGCQLKHTFPLFNIFYHFIHKTVVKFICVSHNVKYIRILFHAKKFFYVNLIHYTLQTLTGIRFGGLKNISYICISKVVFKI